MLFSFCRIAVGAAIAAGLASAIFNDDSSAVWDRIPASSQLEYHDCFDEFKCARLELPLNWWDESNEDTVTIALMKLSAVVSEDDPSFGGTVFIQPGGPGVSGTYTLRLSRHTYRDMLDIPGKKHYEILSFDPRGTGHSSPRINCFPGFQLPMCMVESFGAGSFNLNRDSLNFGISQAKADAYQCEKIHGEFLPYIGTPNVVRDMVAMLDEIAGERRRDEKPAPEPADDARLELRSADQYEAASAPRLQYMGFSYGTLLGNYFASMFPGRVGRMVLDGVCDADDYANGPGWLKNTQGLDAMVTMFFEGCYAAGNPACALCHDADSSPGEISHRFWAWASRLDESPLFTVLDDGMRLFIRKGNIEALLVVSLYNAVFDFQALALDLHEAISGNTSRLFSRLHEAMQVDTLKNQCSNSSALPLIPTDVLGAVTCMDGENVANKSNAYWHDYLQQQLSISSIAGATWTQIRLRCAGWKIQPNWAFRGPFKSPKPSRSADVPEPGRPAAPLLFMSNRHDPVTPLSNARAMSKGHPGSGILIQESMGHCLVAGGMGPCAKDALARYFATGEVPSPEISCDPTRGPWDGSSAEFQASQSYAWHSIHKQANGGISK